MWAIPLAQQQQSRQLVQLLSSAANKVAQCMMQERPEEVPTGELPQNMTLIVDRHLVGKISPGTRVTVIGIYSIYQVHSRS